MPKNISASNSLAIQVKVYYNTINTSNHKKATLVTANVKVVKFKSYNKSLKFCDNAFSFEDRLITFSLSLHLTQLKKDLNIVLKFLPSFMVLTTTTGELLGPSPTEVKANTSNSYSV